MTIVADAPQKFLDKYPIANSEAYLDILMNQDLYSHSMGDIVIDNHSKVVQIYELFWFFEGYDDNLDELIQQAEEQCAKGNSAGRITRTFAIVNNENVFYTTIETYDEKTYIVHRSAFNDREYTYMNDIKNMTTVIQICGIECEVERIACFDLESSTFGTLVYLDTDKGSFVRYYANYMAPAIEMTEGEYQLLAEQYCIFLDSLPDDVGGSMNFAEFIKNPIIVEPSDQKPNEGEDMGENITTGTETEGDGNQNTEPKSDKNSGVSILWWILPAAAVVLSGGAIAFIAYRKKKT